LLHAELRGNIGEVGDPLDAAGLLDLLPALLRHHGPPLQRNAEW
jgi:hypothetical protein